MNNLLVNSMMNKMMMTNHFHKVNYNSIHLIINKNISRNLYNPLLNLHFII